MGYRELSRMEIIEVEGESQRAIAGASGVARETVRKSCACATALLEHDLAVLVGPTL